MLIKTFEIYIRFQNIYGTKKYTQIQIHVEIHNYN